MPAKPLLELDRADDGSAFIAVTYYNDAGIPTRTSVLSHSYQIAVDAVMRRKFEQMSELMAGNVRTQITPAFNRPPDDTPEPDPALTIEQVIDEATALGLVEECQWFEAYNANTSEWVDLRTLDADALHWWERAAAEAGDEGVVAAIQRIHNEEG